MTIREALAALLPFSRQLSGAGGWLLGGWLLGVLTLVGSLGLLGLSGGFLTGAAIAGLTPGTAALFNFFVPGAGVRFFAMLRTASRWAERVVTHEATFRLLAGLRVDLYRHLAPLSPRQLSRYHGSELLNRLMRDIDALDNLYPRLLLPTFAALLVLGAVVVLFAVQAPDLVWLPAVLMVCVVLVLPVSGWYLAVRWAPKVVQGRAFLRQHLLDGVDGLEDLSLHAAAWAQQHCASIQASDQWLQTQLHLARRGAWLRGVVVVVVGLGAWAAIAVLAEHVSAQNLSGPWLVALVLLWLGCAEALLPLVGPCLDVPGTATAAARIQALTQQTPAPVFVSTGPSPAQSDLTLQGLAFAWDAQTPVFSGLSLHIPSGQHLALTGPSGCGKSTLLQLLTRQEDPSEGQILLGCVPLTDLDESTLRSHIACAGQFTWAQAATVADNLRLANPLVSASRMWEVLAVVGLDAEVKAWVDGLNTWVEEGGTSLSGGQRRRLGIARALLRDAPITLLDEPAEGLDAEFERELIQRICTYLKGRTLVWITHRDSSHEAFDRTLDMAVLGEG